MLVDDVTELCVDHDVFTLRFDCLSCSDLLFQSPQSMAIWVPTQTRTEENTMTRKAAETTTMTMCARQRQCDRDHHFRKPRFADDPAPAA